MSREAILNSVRSALGRTAGQPIPPPPPVWLHAQDWPLEVRLASFREKLERLSGVMHEAASQAEAHDIVEALIAGKTAIASNAPLLVDLGISSLPNVQTAGNGESPLRALCATCDFGITSATFALAATGTLVMRASPLEPRMVSLLPPIHIAIVPKELLLVDLDELLTLIPKPLEDTSSMVFITGPSRTGDIEQFLVRGVHGPGVVHVIFL